MIRAFSFLFFSFKAHSKHTSAFRKPLHVWWVVDRKPIRAQTMTSHSRNKLKPDQILFRTHPPTASQRKCVTGPWLTILPHGSDDGNFSWPSQDTAMPLSPLLCPLATRLCEANPSPKENRSCEETLDLNHHSRVVPVIHQCFGLKKCEECFRLNKFMWSAESPHLAASLQVFAITLVWKYHNLFCNSYNT